MPPQASPDWPFLVFGSTIGVVVGSISVRDARPACIPEGALRGPVLPMEDHDDGEIASERVRFKVQQGLYAPMGLFLENIRLLRCELIGFYRIPVGFI